MRIPNTLLAALVALSFSNPASAQLIGSAKPTIIVRQAPSTPLKGLYVILDGSLSEMITGEEEVAKAFAGSGVQVLGASQDMSSMSQLQDEAVRKRVAGRIASVAGPVAFMSVKVGSVAGTEAAFNMALVQPDKGELAVGEVLIDTEKQMVFGGAAQSTRVAIRDACRRFVTDKRIRSMFAN